MSAIGSDSLLATIVRLADERKAQDVRVLNARDVVGYADWIVLLSGNSDRHVLALADGIRRGLREQGVRPLDIEGTEYGRWVVLDLGDVIIHVLLDEVRDYYDFDGLWGKARTWTPRAGAQREAPDPS